jgi:hypothetical protein
VAVAAAIARRRRWRVFVATTVTRRRAVVPAITPVMVAIARINTAGETERQPGEADGHKHKLSHEG